VTNQIRNDSQVALMVCAWIWSLGVSAQVHLNSAGQIKVRSYS
jgi:hypothetical protein